MPVLLSEIVKSQLWWRSNSALELHIFSDHYELFGESQLAVNNERRCLKLTVRSRCSRCGPSWYDEAACTELRQPESRWTPEKWNIDKGDSFGLTRQIWGILGKSILLLTFFENASLEFSVQKSCFQRWNIDKGTNIHFVRVLLYLLRSWRLLKLKLI